MKSTRTKRPPVDVHVRWLIRQDFPEVLAIEEASFPDPWTEGNFLEALRQRMVIAMVAEEGATVVGYILYELRRRSIKLLNMAVHPRYRRRQVGKQILDRIKLKLTAKRRAIRFEIRETNLPGLLFFKSCGFMATGLNRGVFEDGNEDSIIMEYVAE